MQAVEGPANFNEILNPGWILGAKTCQGIAHGLMPFIWRFALLPLSSNMIQRLHKAPESPESWGLRASWIASANQRTRGFILI